ncbi:MAG: TOBE domain-containing protein [Hydrogenimonas sp.]|nr:TOBE domain-containing protein [Hydrogenimonas sp.]
MNKIEGTVVSVTSSGELTSVEVESLGTTVTAFLIGSGLDTPKLSPGSCVWVLFKESEVALAKDFSGYISLRNRFEGEIEKIERGELLAEITVDCRGVKIVSVISKKGYDKMELNIGERVTAMIKANEITLMERE